MDYYVAMLDFGRAGREANVNPEMTRRGVVERIKSGEYKVIAFVHHIHDGVCEDVTNAVLKEAGFYETEPASTRATAVCDIDKNGAIRSITITSPGPDPWVPGDRTDA